MVELGFDKKKERKKERLNDGNNNGRAMHGARKPPGPKMLVPPYIHISNIFCAHNLSSSSQTVDPFASISNSNHSAPLSKNMPYKCRQFTYFLTHILHSVQLQIMLKYW